MCIIIAYSKHLVRLSKQENSILYINNAISIFINVSLYLSNQIDILQLSFILVVFEVSELQ